MKHIKKYPNQDTLKLLYDYDPINGVLIRRETTNCKAKKGDIIGFPNGKGYLECKVGKEKYQVHRLIWIWNNGDIPDNMLINHINEIPNDNRISNLELVSNRENVLKSSKLKNKHGYTGITKTRNRYNSVITYENTKIYLGSFKTPEEASKAYEEKSKELYPKEKG